MFINIINYVSVYDNDNYRNLALRYVESLPIKKYLIKHIIIIIVLIKFECEMFKENLY